MTTQFDGIYHGTSPIVGKFRLAAGGMGWMNPETKDTVTIAATDIKWAQWHRVARKYRLRIGVKDNSRRREFFDGFLKDDQEKLQSLLKQHFGIILESQEVSAKGWNWGATDFRGQDLAFLVSNKTAFEIPLGNVANSNIAGKTEVSLEFSAPKGAPVKGGGDEMVEIRFYVPGTHSKEPGSQEGSENGEKPDGEDEEEEVSAAQAFHDAIKDKADLGEVTGNLIINFEEVLVLTPRGRYDVDMFPDFLRLRGKTYDYKINYSGISRLFLLPKDDQHVLFILSLLNPIRQGQTRYQFLVMQFDREEEITAELNMEEEEIAKYEKLQKHYESLTFEVVSSVFRAVSKNKITGTGSFNSRSGHPSVKANLKATQGDLYFLEKYIFFVAKAPLLIELSDIHQVMFSRVGGAMSTSRSFDLQIVTKSGPEHTLSSVSKEEHEGIENFLKGKKVRVKNQMNEDLVVPALGDDDDDDEDEDMSDVSSGEEVRKPKAKVPNDDDDSEDDEDFNVSSSDAGSPTDDSSDDEEGAASASDASGDRDIIVKKKPANKEKGKETVKKPAKKPKKTDDGDAMDVDEEDSKQKAKPKPKPKPKAKAKSSASGSEEPAKKKKKSE